MIDGTIAALKAIRPDLAYMVDAAGHLVRTQGSNLRFLIRRKETKKYVVGVSFDVATSPRPSSLFISLTDRHTDEKFDAAPMSMTFYGDAFSMAAQIGISISRISVHPSQSIAAQMAALRYGTLSRQITDFFPADPMTIYSKQVKLSGEPLVPE